MFANEQELRGLNAFALYIDMALTADKVVNAHAKSESNFIARSVA